VSRLFPVISYAPARRPLLGMRGDDTLESGIDSQTDPVSGARSGPRVGVRDWTLPCRSHESRDGITFRVRQRPSGCTRGFFS
jgi:hypothetical protein